MGYAVYGAAVSPFVRKVRVVLLEKGLAFDFKPVSPMQPPVDWRDLSPLGKIPALTDGDRKLADSSVICAYLERCNLRPALFPPDNYDYARALWIEEYVDSGMVPQLLAPTFGTLVLGPMLFNKPATRETRDQAMTVAEQTGNPMWSYLDQQLGESEFFVGRSLSIADITVASVHINLLFAGIVPDARRFPRLAAFLSRMYARPSFASCLAEESRSWDRRAFIAAL